MQKRLGLDEVLVAEESQVRPEVAAVVKWVNYSVWIILAAGMFFAVRFLIQSGHEMMNLVPALTGILLFLAGLGMTERCVLSRFIKNVAEANVPERR